MKREGRVGKRRARRQQRLTLDDEEVVIARTYDRRSALKVLGASLLAAGAAIVGGRPALADPLVGDADRFTTVVNPDPLPDDDPNAPPSDPKDADQETPADAGDADVRTMADPKIHAEEPDSDGSLRDPKDADQPVAADSKDAD